MPEIDLDALADELSEFAAPVKAVGRSAREERIVAGFEEVQQFVDAHGRAPMHGEERDIFERLYAVRLERLRGLEEAGPLLRPLDRQGLLDGAGSGASVADELSLDDLAAELADVPPERDIRTLRHVASFEERRAAEEIANRERCADFDAFKARFDAVARGLADGSRRTEPFPTGGTISVGEFFVVGGQTAYVAEKGIETTAANGQVDARLRVIYSNETESNLLLRSLQRALEKDESGRRIVEADAPTLFSGEWEEDDVQSGTIYVLRSLSDDPYIAAHRELIHKIGVTGGSVESRIAHAEREATYLLAKVEVVATYKLAAVNRTKLEALFHRIFASAQLDLTLSDRFGNPVRPREWFLVPLPVIDDAVRRVQDGSITDVIYDPATASLRLSKKL